jgi:hypothetical protein
MYVLEERNDKNRPVRAAFVPPAMHCRQQQAPLELLPKVRWWDGAELGWGPPGAPAALHLGLDAAADGHHGEGGESEAALGVESQDLFPKPNAPGLAGLLVGQGTRGQPLQDLGDPGFVLADQVIQTIGADLLGMLELLQMEWGRMVELCKGVS